MSDPGRNMVDMSPEERACLEQHLLKRAASFSGRPTIPRRQTTGPCPLSFAQQRLWFLDQLEPGQCTYNVSQAMQLNGRLDVAALERALGEIVGRHEALRTTFEAVDGSPVQVIHEPAPFQLAVTDLSRRPPAEREAEVRRLLDAEVGRPFDLAHDLMLRAILLRLAEDEHLLLLVLHHIASDGWSIGVLHRELAALYDAFAAGRPSPLPELPLQYADYALWQRERLQGDALEEQVSYWRRQLEGVTRLELPTDHPRPAVPTQRGARQAFELPVALVAGLGALARSQGATLFMVMLAAFQTLLQRYSGQDDIVVGIPIAGRSQPELEGLIGFFANTLVLRVDLLGDPSFLELVGRVREVALGAYAHQNLPFERLVQELQPARSLGQTPLFQVALAFQNAPRRPLELAGLVQSWLETPRTTARFDMMMNMIDGRRGLTGSIEYSTDLFDATTIARMVEHYRVLLDGIVAGPERRISELPILPEGERQLLKEWNNTHADYPREACIHELFEAQAVRTPEAVALEFEGQQMCYGELNARANQLARHLQKRGVGPEVLVGLCVERSLEMVVGLLGILKAGGAYLPLDPAYPEARLAFMLEDAGARVLLTQERLQRQLPARPAEVVCLDKDWPGIAQESAEDLPTAATAESLAYVIYTSGSTGRPKGVEVVHRSVANLLSAMRQEVGLSERDCLLAVTTLSFDVAAADIFLPLVSGARVAVAGWHTTRDGLRLREEIARSGATIMQATPATWQLLLESGWQGTPGLKIVCTGEALSSALAAQLLARGEALWNLYGPTETTIWSTGCRVRSVTGIVPIGRPLANTQAYVLGRRLQLAPVGVPGELHIGGVGVARGYLGQPVLTAERFIRDPFSDDPQARLYKTGDLVRYLPDGNLEFLGRLDHQVKIRGYRIELGEVEAVLSEHPAVRRAVVVVREDRPGDRRLVAYVVARAEEAPTAAELRGFLREQLPEYMMPAAFVMLDALPLTASGKVDRRALPLPGPEAVREAVVGPRTPVEEILAEIWSAVLGCESVGIHDDFFALGGHSLLAIQVIARVRDAFGVELPVLSIFEQPTIAGLALTIVQALLEADDGSEP